MGLSEEKFFIFCLKHLLGRPPPITVNLLNNINNKMPGNTEQGDVLIKITSSLHWNIFVNVSVRYEGTVKK